MDHIVIRDLRASTTLGVGERERAAQQEVLLNLRLGYDDLAAARTDRIEDAVDYRVLKNDLLAFLAAARFHLVEALAEAIAQRCLGRAGVREVTVTVDKPGALTGARSVGVEITRWARKPVRIAAARPPRPGARAAPSDRRQVW